MKESEYYQNKGATQVRVGIITVLALIVLIGGYGWLRDWFNQGKYTQIRVRFINAGNIEPGNHVTVYGVKRGRVDSISMTEQGVILNLLVDIDFPLPRDTKFFISDSDLMGNRQVDIIPGITKEIFDPDYIPNGQNLAGLSSLIPRIDGIIGNLDQMISKLAMQDELFENFQHTIVSSKRLMERLDNFFVDNYQEIEDIVANLHQTSAQINSLFSEEDESLQATFRNIAQGLEEFDTVLQKLSGLLDEIEPLVTKLNEEEGTVQQLISDQELYDRLIEATAQVDSLLYDIRQNPRRYFQFRLF